MADDPLATLREDIEAHWREHLPKMVAELEAGGELQDAIDYAARLTEEVVREAVAKGASFDAAWETYRGEWAFLPPEEEPEEEMRDDDERGEDDDDASLWF